MLCICVYRCIFVETCRCFTPSPSLYVRPCSTRVGTKQEGTFLMHTKFSEGVMWSLPQPSTGPMLRCVHDRLCALLHSSLMVRCTLLWSCKHDPAHFFVSLWQALIQDCESSTSRKKLSYVPEAATRIARESVLAVERRGEIRQ